QPPLLLEERHGRRRELRGLQPVVHPAALEHPDLPARPQLVRERAAQGGARRAGVRSPARRLGDRPPAARPGPARAALPYRRARWVVDASGRVRLLARRMNIGRPSPIRHHAAFAWVEGNVDLEALSDLAPRARRLRPERARLGHTPPWLATNHFMGEGFWFWTIPLHGLTSLGAVYDPEALDAKLSTPAELIDWAVREFPLFARDLPARRIVDHGALRYYAHDCGQALSTARWALVGEAGRFSDPLYSPGGDLIAIYNTLVVDAVLTADPALLARKVPLYERLMRAVYEAYVPSFVLGYWTHGDQESFSLRY